VKIIMPYIGRVLSVNYYKVVGRGGVKTNRTKPETERWMGELADKVRGLPFGSNLTIKLFGKFRDERVPDLSNLHKVIADAVAEGLGVDDKDFKFVDLGYETGCLRPVLEIELINGG